jgi:hypothetical protein
MKEIEMLPDIWTANYAFTIKLLGDAQGFVAVITGFTPRLAVGAKVVVPKVPMIQSFGPEELRDTNRKKTIEQCRNRIQEIDGEIIKWL